jgi:signal transduction histidine kinase
MMRSHSGWSDRIAHAIVGIRRGPAALRRLFSGGLRPCYKVERTGPGLGLPGGAEPAVDRGMIERMVEDRTRELEARSRQLEAEIIRRQNVEAQLLQAQKLESIGQLAAGIAHEINTPMQFLCDNLEYLSDCSKRLFEVVDAYEKNLFSPGEHKSWGERKQELRDMMARNRFDTIRQQVPQAISESLDGIQRVIHIVRAMKEFSHPGSEQKLGVDLNNAVSSMVTITRNRWKYVAELETDLDPDLPTLNCVPADINQVLMNLIVNAADAIAEKVGDQGMEKGQITIRTGTDGLNIVVEVEDTGCGIPENIRNRIFDPFFTTKEVGQGTGQGLAICYNVVVNKHRGRVDVLSTPGVGSTFRIELPRALPEPNETQDRVAETESCDPIVA